MKTEEPVITIEDSDSEDEAVELLLKEDLKKEVEQDDFKSFEQMSVDSKIQKLQALVQQSQVFSNIISETLLESSLAKKKEREEKAKLDLEQDKENEEPPRKKSKRGKKEKSQGSILDFFGKQKKPEVSEETKATKAKLEQTANNGYIKQPSLVTGAVMRDYQLEGAEWLITLYENGLNGILADEMGLGKTIQCIALLAFLYEQGVQGPFLVTAPLSTVGNWVNEIKRFAPGLPVLRYAGLKDERKEIRAKHFTSRAGFKEAVIVTSYETVLRDFEYLNKVEWKFLIVDEGHRLKNVNCKLIRELKRLRTQNRLLLTGTPLQNNLNELWSLLNFILPEIFHDLELFQKWFDFSSLTDLKNDTDDSTKALIDSKIQEALVQNLHTILKPFLLRRVKKTALTTLVEKKEFIVYGTLTDIQSKLYKSALFKGLRKEVIKFALRERVAALKLNVSKRDLEKFLADEIDGEAYDDRKAGDEEKYFRLIKNGDDDDCERDMNKTEKKLYKELKGCLEWVYQKKLENLAMQLRLICDSPYLFYYPWDDEDDMPLDKLLETSAKLQLLDQLVPKLIEKGHKVLIFAQFTTMMAFIQDWCDLKGYDHCYLDGMTAQEDREEQIKTFNEDPEAKVFILSTRSGGLGLNLCSADSVILFDSDWNPQVDLQAMDRVHRIGQEKPVAIYRFIISNTIEEVLLAKADAKRKLEKLVIQMGKFQSLRRLMDQGNAMAKGRPKTADQGQLAKELATLLEDNVLKAKEHDIADNKLTEEELDVLCDRSPESYKMSAEEFAKYPHIQFFETSTSLE